MKGYTSRELIENYLGYDIDSGFYDQIDEWIEEVEKYIDNLARTTFVAEQGEYYYDGKDTDLLLIDDFTSIDSVELDDEEIEAEGYPKNTPYYGIYYEDEFDEGIQNVKVTGKKGFSDSVPKDIQKAATILASGLIKKEGSVQQERLGDYTVQYKEDSGITDFDNALNIIKSYQKQI